jgi:hypothetical protein
MSGSGRSVIVYSVEIVERRIYQIFGIAFFAQPVDLFADQAQLRAVAVVQDILVAELAFKTRHSLALTSPSNYWLDFLHCSLDSFSEPLAVDIEHGGLAAESDEKVVQKVPLSIQQIG